MYHFEIAFDVNAEYKPITLPELYPIYAVSNYGNIINTKSEKFMQLSEYTNGYIGVALSGPNGAKKYLVHRLVLLTFRPIENSDVLYVNHIDGNKRNNYLGNLEWTTPSENDYHALRTGLRTNFLDGHPNSKFTNEQVHKICKYIDEGYENGQIADIMYNDSSIQNRMHYINLRKAISAIRKGDIWTRISEQYEFSKYNISKGSTTIS